MVFEDLKMADGFFILKLVKCKSILLLNTNLFFIFLKSAESSKYNFVDTCGRCINDNNCFKDDLFIFWVVSNFEIFNFESIHNNAFSHAGCLWERSYSSFWKSVPFGSWSLIRQIELPVKYLTLVMEEDPIWRHR